jgi:hypothetical protein
MVVDAARPHPVKVGHEERFEPAPLLGEHTEEILCGLLGHSSKELDEWRSAGIA